MSIINTAFILELFVDVFAEPILELELILVSGTIFEVACECRGLL